MTNYEYFEWCFRQVVNIEGGLSKDPGDLGNKDGNFTYMGLSSRYNPEIKGIIKLPKDKRLKEIRRIYYTKYWQKVAVPIISLVSPLKNREENNILKHLAFIMFDAAVQYAPDDANRMLQEAINRIMWEEAKYANISVKLLKVDGVIGNKTTLSLLIFLKYGVIDSYLYLRALKYMKLIGKNKEQAKFAKGWANRLFKIDNLYGETE